MEKHWHKIVGTGGCLNKNQLHFNLTSGDIYSDTVTLYSTYYYDQIRSSVNSGRGFLLEIFIMIKKTHSQQLTQMVLKGYTTFFASRAISIVLV